MGWLIPISVTVLVLASSCYITKEMLNGNSPADLKELILFVIIWALAALILLIEWGLFFKFR